MAQIVSNTSEKMSSTQLVDRIFAMLRVVASSDEGVTVTEVAKQTGLPKSTVSRLFSTLEQVEAVTRLPDSKHFTIGSGIISLAARVPHTQQLAAIAQPYLQSLHESIGETVALTLPEGDNAYVVTQITSRHAIQVRDWTGVRIPMSVQSTGRVFLAERTDEALDRYLAAPLTPYTAKTVCEPTAFRAILAQIRQQGYAWVFEELEEGMTAMAVPVREASGRVVAAVNVFGPSFRFPVVGGKEEVTRRVIETAQQIAGRLPR